MLAGTGYTVGTLGSAGRQLLRDAPRVRGLSRSGKVQLVLAALAPMIGAESGAALGAHMGKEKPA